MSWRNRSLQHRKGLWRLSSAVGVITPDDSGFGNAGTMVNAPTFADTIWGLQCMEFDGDDAHVNLGDLTYLNLVSEFTIALWINQKVIDQADNFFIKRADTNSNIQFFTLVAGFMRIAIENGGAGYGQFDYSTVIVANNWHHIAVVFDGSQIGNANRLTVYIDGRPVTLAFTGTIQPTTADLGGVDALIGNTVSSFDGKIFDVQIHSAAYSRDEVNAIMRNWG